MADKTYEIEVKTTADTEGVTSVKDALSQTKEEAEQTREALEQAFSDATAEVERLEDALDEAHMNGDDIEADIIADELAEARDSAEELESELENLNSSFDEITPDAIQGAKESTDELGESARSTDEDINQLNADLGVIEASAYMGMAEQLGQLGDSAEGMAQDMNQASISVGQLSTNVGMAEPQMVSLINNISNATFPQNEAMAYVGALNQMGVSAEHLGDSATNMDRINDATGIGYQKVMQLTQGLQSVGVSADNLPSSFNAIAYAQANVNGGADTLTTVLKRQASTINEYGLNTDQLVLIMQKLSEKGVQGMKMGSELSKVLKDANGDTTALEQSLGMTAGALSNASETTGQYEGKLQDLANEEAEHKSILDQLGAFWEDLSLQMSPVLSPMASFMGLIGQAGSWAVGVNGILQLAETMGLLKVANISTTLSNWALAISEWAVASPILILVGIILILIGVLVYLYFNNEQVRNAVDGLGQAFLYAGQLIYTAFMDAINWIIGALQNLWNYIITLGGLIPQNVSITGNQIVDTVLKVMGFIATLPLQLAMIFTNMIAKTLGFGNNFVQNMIKAGSNSVNNFITYISQLPSKLAQELNNMLSLVGEWASTLPQKFWDAGVNAVKNFLNALGIHSPGIMQTKLLWEVSEMGRRIPNESQALLSNVNQLGKDVVDEFGNPILNVGSEIGSLDSNKGNGGQVNYFYFNDTVVDNEERMEKICDYITKKISWNNKTAGRTI